VSRSGLGREAATRGLDATIGGFAPMSVTGVPSSTSRKRTKYSEDRDGRATRFQARS
jgi:hypothetical protein